MHQHQEASTQDLLGKLCSGEKKLAGKVFYLDNLKKRPAALLVEAIYFQGGRVESFLHKGVSFVVTGNHIVKKEREAARGALVQEDNILIRNKQQPGHSKPKACGSRGKALLEKAIRNNNERQGSSILANAKAWGVEILFVDSVLLYLKHLNKETLRKQKKPDQNPVVKAIALRSPYIKIEDVNRRYKPLHVQAMNFPILHFSNKFSPFESPSHVLKAGKALVKNRINAGSAATVDDSHSALSPSPWRYRKKDHSFCECCHQPFSNFEEHLQSGQHRAFVQDSSNYSLVDRLVSQMLPGFSLTSLLPAGDRHSTPSPAPHTEELLPLTDAAMEDALQDLRRHGANGGSLSSNPKWMAACGSPAASELVGPYPIPEVETPPKLSSVCPVQVKEPSSTVIMQMNLDFDQLNPDGQQAQQPLPPCEPYSQPPVLSPQIPKSDECLEPHRLYSDPPVLSPQCYSEMDSNFESFPRSNLEAPSWQNLDFLPSNSSDRRTKKRHVSTPVHMRCKRRRAVTANGGGLTGDADEVLSGKSQADIASQSHLSPRWKPAHPGCTVEMFFERRVAQICPQKQEQSAASRLCEVQPLWLGPCVQLFNEPLSCQDTKPSPSTSFCVDSTLIPDVGELVSSSDSDWDCELLPQPQTTAAPGHRHLRLQSCELDKDVLQRQHAWMHDGSYESRLHTVLQPEKSAAARLMDGVDQAVFSRTLVQIVEVQH